MIDNVQLAQQLAAAQERILSMLEQQRSIMREQVDLVRNLTSGSGEKQGGLLSELEKLKRQLDGLGDSSDSFESKLNGALGSVDKEATKLGRGVLSTASILKQLKKSAPVAVLAGFASGLQESGERLMTLTQMGTSFLSLLKQIAESAYSITMAIVSIPFRIFSGLIRLASALAAEYKHIAEAFEAFRGQFGAFYNEAGKALKEGLATAREMGKLSGLGFYSVFQDTAVAVKFFQEQFSGLGSLLDSFGPEIGKLGDQFIHLTKGMGLTAEELKSVAVRAKSSGRTLIDTLAEVANQTLQLAEQFGISNKLLAKDVVSMSADVKTFGNAGVKSLTAVAVRVRSLGLEVKNLAGIVDKFLNFEDAARSASMLSQSFGVNLDTIGLMNSAAKDQADLLDKLRNAMFAAGRDATKMSTAELRLLAQTTGLSEAEAKLAFSMSNRGRSLEEIRKQAEKAESKELSQVQAMSKLADAIERVIRVFQYESFFGAFIQGFSRGIKHSAPFIATLLDLQSALDRTREAGEAVGRMFVSKFPGVLEMLKALQRTFNSDNFTKLKKSLTGTFSTLFDDLSKSDPKAAVKTFWSRLKSSFKIITDAEEKELWEPLRQGFFKFLGALGSIAAGTIPLIKDAVTQALRYFVDGLTKGFTSPEGQLVKAAEDSASKFWTVFLSPIWSALKEAWHDPAFQDALSDLGTVIMDMTKKAMKKAGNLIMDNPGIVLGVVAALSAVLLGPAVVSGLASGVAFFGSALVAAIGSSIASSIGVVPMLIGAAIAAAVAGAIGVAAVSVAISKGWDGFGSDFVTPLIDKIPAIGGDVSDAMKEALQVGIEVLGSLGDIIVDALDGGGFDETRFRKLGQSVGEALVFALKTSVITMPKIILKGMLAAGAAIIKYSPTVLAAGTKLISIVTDFMSGVASQVPIVGGMFSWLFTTISSSFSSGSDLWLSIQEGWSGFLEGIKSGWEAFDIASMFNIAFDLAKQQVKIHVDNIALSITNGLRTGLMDIPNIIASSFQGGIDLAKDYLGIASPSEVFRRDIGLNMAAGVAVGLSQGLIDVPSLIADSIGNVDLVSTVAGDTATALQSIVSQVNQINRSLDLLPELDIPVKIEKVGKVLGIKNDTLKLELKPLNLNINLKLTVEADKLAEVLIDTKKFIPR